ncbi:unnamed protein product [Mytilus coruscus]|uniref:Uncharacterized protein n=1 Tax=Mytilus coruscus TaxID=42192 RepID=A0A6J8AI36_MYTCO|nr:unnamed protein product [Mytilus coruscus]
MAGIPGICTRVKSHGYEESYFNYLNTTKLEDIKNIFRNVRDRLESIQCKVVFVPITTMNIRNWNAHRFDIGKTSKLLYFPEYEIMQAHLNHLIKQINKFITMTNELKNLVTPFLHTYVHKSSGLKTRYINSKLVDGVHPTESLSEKWKIQLLRAMEVNEENMKMFTM